MKVAIKKVRESTPLWLKSGYEIHRISLTQPLVSEKPLHTPKTFPIGERVLILHPAYVAGKIGVVRAQEILSDGQPSGRWLIEIGSENIIVSLSANEFQVIIR
ncbi:hypothetical protein [Tolypothrix sp. VBCCA 56010]|uniref:hypothetical protein n=1 Tax=Tolypothrix sp. VBCCA 56010 TaxID=3137731 RepID=UPI003D7CF9A9